jgi:hypothetical protein
MPADQSYAAQTELTRLLEELSARSLADQARATERYRALLEQLAAGGIDVVTLRAEYERLVSEQSARLAHDLTTLGVNYYRAVLDLNRASVERLFDELLSGAREQHMTGNGAPPPPAPPGPTVVELRLGGRPGDVVEAGLAIENKRAEPADVVFLISDFADDTGEPFRASLVLDPPRLHIEPASESPIQLRLELDPAQFVAGHQYLAQVLVRGTDELELRLVVDVTE